MPWCPDCAAEIWHLFKKYIGGIKRISILEHTVLSPWIKKWNEMALIFLRKKETENQSKI